HGGRLFDPICDVVSRRFPLDPWPILCWRRRQLRGHLPWCTQSVGPVELSSLEESTDIPLSRLPGYSRQRIETGLPAQDLNHAHEILVDLDTALIPEAPPVSPNDQPDDTDIPIAENGVSASASIAGATAGAMGGNP